MRKKLIPAMITAVTVAQLSVVNVLAAPEELPEVSPEMTLHNGRILHRSPSPQ